MYEFADLSWFEVIFALIIRFWIDEKRNGGKAIGMNTTTEWNEDAAMKKKMMMKKKKKNKEVRSIRTNDLKEFSRTMEQLMYGIGLVSVVTSTLFIFSFLFLSYLFTLLFF